MEEQDVKSRVILAIVELYLKDAQLLTSDANERSITHKLGEHLQHRFPGWHVDCEYNRHGSSPKNLTLPLRGKHTRTDATEACTVYPDIIIHKRGTDTNLAVIEVKKQGGGLETQDEDKIKAFSLSDDYRYQYGLFLRLGSTEDILLKRFLLKADEWDDWSQKLRGSLKELKHGG